MDYSAAQMNGHAEEYADAVISTITSFSTLSAESQAIERVAAMSTLCLLKATCLTMGLSLHLTSTPSTGQHGQGCLAANIQRRGVS